jgi:hypothetical protein
MNEERVAERDVSRCTDEAVRPAASEERRYDRSFRSFGVTCMQRMRSEPTRLLCEEACNPLHAPFSEDSPAPAGGRRSEEP